MAYPARGRDPLLDSETQAVLEKRGREALGASLVVAGLLMAVVLATYSPTDPNWILDTGGPIENWGGYMGASVAASLYKIIGLGAWGMAAVAIAWGLRLALHLGAERALPRLIHAPSFWAVASLYAATLTPSVGWGQAFSLGGHFGDTVLFLVLNILPFSAAFGANLLGLILGVATFALGVFVLGFTFPELRVLYARATQYTAWAVFAAMLGLSKLGIMMRDWRASRRVEDWAAEAEQSPRGPLVRRADPALAARVAATVRANPAMPTGDAHPPLQTHHFDDIPEWQDDAPADDPAPQSLFARMPSIFKSVAGHAEPAPAPQVQEFVQEPQEDVTDDRIKSRISEAIRSRVRPPNVVADQVARSGVTGPTPMHIEPTLSRDLGIKTSAPELPLETPAAPLHLGQEYRDDPETDAVIEPPMTAAPRASFNPIRSAVQAAERRIVQHQPRKATPVSKQARAEAQPGLQFEEPSAPAYELPPLSLLANADTVTRHVLSDEALAENARMLESVLDDYGVKGEIVSVRPGPVVTMYELEPAPGLKASRVIGLADDIARSMSALAARVSTVPGRSVIGIELPNENREKVVLREILSTRDFGDGNLKLPLALGKDIGGDPIVANLAKMPHLLIAGTTGSGKSVAINTMILSLLYKLSPEECRMIMIDPKMLELSVYDGIPHLLSPVVTDPKKAVVALKWVVGEMEDRYKKMSKMGVRNIDGYNSRVEDTLARGETFSRTVQTGFDDATGDPVFETEEITPVKLPYIVVVVDEMADLMMVAGKEIEACIQRLAQMARASGIHLIMATQRPSVDVITGTIKANFPTRISFQVTSKIDSRTILGEMGAEQLLGMGDMLYMAGGGKITRIHGPFCSDEEVEEIVNYLKTFGPPDYVGGVVEGPDEDKESNIDAVLGLGGNTEGEDALYDQAVQIVIQDRKCSTSYIQRKLAIGYNKAARLVEQMEDNQLVSPANHVGKREILVPEQAAAQYS